LLYRQKTGHHMHVR